MTQLGGGGIEIVEGVMIQPDQELKATQERIAYFEGLVAQFRVITSPQEFKLMAGGFLDEIEKMHAEVME